MTPPNLSDSDVKRLYDDLCADPTRKDFYGPFFYRALLEDLFWARLEARMAKSTRIGVTYSHAN